MRTTFFAVAFAAAVTAFASNAQEAPEIAARNASPISNASAPTAAKTKSVKSIKASQPGKRVRTEISRGKIDMTTTGSIQPRAPKGARTASAKGPYGHIIARYAAAYGVPTSLAHAVIRIESNYRVNARGRAGEVGLMQIKPSTARGLGYSGSTAALFNPETNIKWGMKYLGMAQKLGGGSTCGTILKYNAGHGAKRMNPVSAAYCSKVKRHMGA
ncbi:MAG: transglycosylase SLT domain-containing protein [Mesorhizobium sp.]